MHNPAFSTDLEVIGVNDHCPYIAGYGSKTWLFSNESGLIFQGFSSILS